MLGAFLGLIQAQNTGQFFEAKVRTKQSQESKVAMNYSLKAVTFIEVQNTGTWLGLLESIPGPAERKCCLAPCVVLQSLPFVNQVGNLGVKGLYNEIYYFSSITRNL